ncbi:hypothetical protein LD112_24950 [Pantoea agglomerans]|nr:hypothetical protein [Pantoea agglomerans]
MSLYAPQWLGGTTSVVGLAGGLQASINLADVFQRNIRIDGIETGSVHMLEEMLEWFSLKKDQASGSSGISV